MLKTHRNMEWVFGLVGKVVGKAKEITGKGFKFFEGIGEEKQV